MNPFDRELRDLLPLLQEDPDEIHTVAEWEGGLPTPSGETGPLPVPDTHAPSDEPPLPELAGREVEVTPFAKQASTASGSHADGAPRVAEAANFEEISAELDFKLPEMDAPDLFSIDWPVAIRGYIEEPPGNAMSSDPPSDPAKGPERDAAGGQEAPVGDESDGPVDQGAQTPVPVGGTVEEPAPVVSPPEDDPDIAVTQTAVVDQDVDVLVRGYPGQVVTRIHLDQEIIMDQDVEIDLNIDGGERFAIRIGQQMYVGQYTDLEIDIFDEDGVLYVDLNLRDFVVVEQSTVISAHFGDGPGGSTALVSQDMALDQKSDVDIDIEDELEALYNIQVDVALLQSVGASQAAYLQLASAGGVIEYDIDAHQSVTVEQDTTVRIDFSLA